MSVMLLILLSIVTVALEAVTLMLLWDWFVVPATGFPSISIALALGLMLCLVMFVRKDGRAVRDIDGMTAKVTDALASTIVVLVLGWVVSFFV